MTDEQPRRSPVNRLLIVIGVALIGSYTAYRLRHLSNNLPYDPGDPFPVVEVAPTPPETLSERVRSALLARRSVRIGDDPERTTLAWPLRGIERERMLRSIDMQLAATLDVPPAQRTRQHNINLATWVAVRKLLDQDLLFVVDGDVPALAGASQQRWQDFRVTLITDGDRERVAYALIDKDEFGFVRQAPDADPATF
ncbi:MAG: hypothetical protein KAI24_26210, partial [Planctomycetes bacterium]|nr:hypothetical protein [Planctomycetota bacterium]